jgi:hypothetical protein
MTKIGNRQTPDEGKLLTNGEVFSRLVYLGEGASEWEEVDDTGQLNPE